MQYINTININGTVIFTLYTKYKNRYTYKKYSVLTGVINV